MASSPDSQQTALNQLSAALQVLRERDHFIQRITETSPDVIYVYDYQEERNVFANREVATTLGYSVEEVQRMGSALVPTIVLPADLAWIPDVRRRLMHSADHEVVEFEYRVRHKAGNIRWLLGREVVFARDEQGLPRQVLGIAQDITKRKEAELALQQANERERRLREVAESLRDVATTLTSSLDASVVTQHLFVQLQRVVAFDGAAFFIKEGDALVLTVGIGLARRYQGRRELLASRGVSQRVFWERRLLRIDDTFQAPDWVSWDQDQPIRSWMGAPLICGDVLIGILTVDHCQPNAYCDDDLRTLQAFAIQAAIALTNAQRYAQAQSEAAEQERQRLARDLHDSVSQSLLAATRTAEVLPQLWELDPDEGRAALDEVTLLTRAALAEMRTLLVELRPAMLSQARLPDLLAHLCAVAGAKARVLVETALDPAPALPPEIQVALYRIVQEALNNVVKHASARRLRVGLGVAPAVDSLGNLAWEGELTLTVCDDGQGFNPNRSVPGHMGLESMRERAQAIGATLEIASSLGQGTQLRLNWRGRSESLGEEL